MLTIVIAIVTSVVLVTLLIALYMEFKIFKSRVESLQWLCREYDE